MTLTITGTTITSDRNPHTARQAPGRPHQREGSWLPGQVLDRNTAITAMILAGIAGRGDLREGHQLWPHLQGRAAELGLTGPDAMHKAGRREAEAEIAPQWSQVTAVVRGPDLDEIEARRWGPGGRAHFAGPRPNDYPARTARRPELEARA